MINDKRSKQHAKRINRELLKAGVTLYGMRKAESRYLPRVIHPNEHIEAVVYGQHHDSSAMLIATDHRIIYLDKKPMATFMDEVTYDVVSGIELDVHTFFATVTLHTAVANYEIRYVNIHCADTFTRFIEDQKVKKGLEQKRQYERTSQMEKSELIDQVVNTLSGYYLIPKESEEKERTPIA